MASWLRKEGTEDDTKSASLSSMIEQEQRMEDFASGLESSMKEFEKTHLTPFEKALPSLMKAAEEANQELQRQKQQGYRNT